MECLKNHLKTKSDCAICKVPVDFEAILASHNAAEL